MTWPENSMNLPNKLTVTRILLTFIFLWLITQHGLAAAVAATVVFTLASLTDLCDGYLAKRYNLITDFGKLMDPVADKFLMLAAFLVFARLQIVAEWMVVLILVREFLVTGFRIFATTKGKVLSAERAGKYKTVSQIVAIFAVLGFIVFKEYFSITGRWSYSLEAWWLSGIDILMLIAVTFTLISGALYFWNNRRVIYAQ
jgi:CDP-diacylglycerol--glycerol-3-phosphate 3-phosphatidyltransferase